MNIYQSDIFRKDLSRLHFDDKLRVQETQEVKERQSRISILKCWPFPSTIIRNWASTIFEFAYYGRSRMVHLRAGLLRIIRDCCTKKMYKINLLPGLSYQSTWPTYPIKSPSWPTYPINSPSKIIFLTHFSPVFHSIQKAVITRVLQIKQTTGFNMNNKIGLKWVKVARQSVGL